MQSAEGQSVSGGGGVSKKRSENYQESFVTILKTMLVGRRAWSQRCSRLPNIKCRVSQLIFNFCLNSSRWPSTPRETEIYAIPVIQKVVFQAVLPDRKPQSARFSKDLRLLQIAILGTGGVIQVVGMFSFRSWPETFVWIPATLGLGWWNCRTGSRERERRPHLQSSVAKPKTELNRQRALHHVDKQPPLCKYIVYFLLSRSHTSHNKTNLVLAHHNLVSPCYVQRTSLASETKASCYLWREELPNKNSLATTMDAWIHPQFVHCSREQTRMQFVKLSLTSTVFLAHQIQLYGRVYAHNLIVTGVATWNLRARNTTLA